MELYEANRACRWLAASLMTANVYELNFIGQCWGYSKRMYREFPMSSKEADLERNVLAALEAVPLDAVRR
jgi:hypothetical protein